MDQVVGTAPTRVDLAGGTLDLWPVHHLLDHKTTVNVAITLPARVKIAPSESGLYELVSEDQGESFQGNFAAAVENPRLPLFGLMLSAFWTENLPAIKIQSEARSPAGAGLGGSSCLAVTLGASLWKARQQFEPIPDLDETRLVQTAQDVEARLIRSPTGCQDYWGAVRGSVNIIDFPFGGVSVATLEPKKIAQELDETMIICYSGRSRASAINNWEIFKRVFDHDREIVENFNRIGRLAEECGDALRTGDLDLALDRSHREWLLRCDLWPGIETAETRRIDAAARQAGAKFSRVCGAGGGGVMGVFAKPSVRQKVVDAVSSAGGTVLDARLSASGLTVYST